MTTEVKTKIGSKFDWSQSRPIKKLGIWIFLAIMLSSVLISGLVGFVCKLGYLNLFSFCLIQVLFLPIFSFVSRKLACLSVGSVDKMCFSMAELCHEMASPITSLRAAAASLSLVAKSDFRIERESASIESSCQRLEHLSGDLKLLSCWGIPVKHSELSVVSLSQLTRSCVDELASRIASHGSRVEFTIIGQPTLIADAIALRRVFLNLLENSIKYNEKGTLIEFEIKASQDCNLVLYRDNGQGVPLSVLDKVFDRSFRFVSDGVLAPAGSGLGLAIAKEIVEAHGGSISARQFQPNGIEFVMNLPRVPNSHPLLTLLR